MKKRVLSLLLVMVMVLGLLPTGVLAAEGATEVSSQEGLAGMTDSGSYVLTQDITLNEWTVIDFSGTLDGNGHTITLGGQPLFNELSGTVQNLLVEGVVDYSDSAVGAIAITLNGGTVNNCWSGTGYDSWETFAGFVGTMAGGTIKNCLSTYDMADYGIAAEADGGSVIENCYYSSGYGVSDGSFADTDNEGINADQYPYAMAQLNAAHEAGLLYWAMDTDGIPKPISSDEPEVDCSELEALYESVQDQENAVPGEDGISYTEDSWTAFVTARDQAKAVIDDETATQAAIDAAKEALQAAIDGLTPDRSGTTEEQRSALQELISSAPTEKGSYTDESFAAVEEQVEAAEGLLADSAATSEQLTQQIADLQNAIDALEDIKEQVAAVTPPEGEEWQMISTAEELADLSENGGTGYYKLANDITEYVGYYSWNGKYQAFNGVLDGDGHTVTFAGADKNPNPVINTLGSEGVIQNLGVKGSISNPALVNKLDGKLINCYSWAESHYGGLVGEMRSGSVIANCYANEMPGGSNSGGLAYTGNGGHILNSYWPGGEAIGDNTNTSVLNSQVVAKQKEDSFLSMLNTSRYGGMEWHQSETGLPWLGEEQEYVKPDFATVTVTSLLTEETASIEDPDDVLQVSVFGEQGGGVATLTIDGYQGDELEWETPSHPTNAPIKVYYDRNAKETRVWVRNAGTVTVTAFLKGEGDTPREELQSFQIEAKAPSDFELKLKINGEDYTGKTYRVPGSEGFELVPYVLVGGEEIPVYYGLFNWDSSNSEAIHVDSDAWVTIYKEGSATLTASLNGVSASVTVNAGYTAVTGIECLFKGEYTIHRRSPNSVGQNGTPGEASFNPLRHLKDGAEWVGSEEMMAKVLPEGATYAGSYTVTTDNPEVMQFQSALVQNLIPMKAGTVNVTVSTNDPKLDEQFTDTEEVTLKYLNPLKELSVKNETLTVKVGETIDAGLSFTGENDNKWPVKYPQGLHVSESYMTWEQSGSGAVNAYRSYPVIMQGDEDYSLAEGTVSNDEWLIKGVKEGDVTLTGTAKDTTNGTKTVTLTIHVVAGDPSLNKPVKEQVSEALAKTSQYQLKALEEKTPAFMDEWSILGLARAGIQVPQNFYETYYASAYEKVMEQKDVTNKAWESKVTETQRLALALTAIGKDPTNVGGVNLLDYSWNKETYWNNALGSFQGSNELIYALIATNAHNSFKQPEAVSITREQMINKLLTEFQAPEGGFGLSGPSFDVDITGMALQALAPYYGTRGDVKTAVDKAVLHLSQAQGTDGSYGNPESTSQVIVALCTLGIDPDADERFVKAGSSLVDGLLMYGLEDGSFRHAINGGANGMATEQALYTLAALKRFYANPKGNALYDMNDVNLRGEGSDGAVTGVTIIPDKDQVMAVGDTMQIMAKVLPVDAANKNISWSSSDSAVVAVDESGLATAKKLGTATITVTTNDGGKTASLKITVQDTVAVTGVSLTAPKNTLEEGKTIQLEAQVKPANATNRKVIYTTSDRSVATVSADGVVKGVAEGKVTIYVATKDGNFTDSVDITVKSGKAAGTVKLSVDLLTIGKDFIIKPQEVELKKGDTVWDVLKRELDDRGISCEYSNYAQYGSIYVASINGVGEFDNGPGSGWKYNVNGVYPEYGCSRYVLEDGDYIQWRYTTNLGDDLEDFPITEDEEKKEEGEEASVVLRPEVKPNKNGEAKVTVDEETFEKSMEQAGKENAGAIRIQPKVKGVADTVSVELPTSSVKTAARKGMSIVVDTPDAAVELDKTALGDLAGERNSSVTVSVETMRSGKLDVSIKSGSKTVSKVGNGVRITLSDVRDAGDVVVLVNGSREELLKKSAVYQGEMTARLSGSATILVEDRSENFRDVSYSYWGKDAVDFVSARDLFKGTSDNTFSPGSEMSRGMLATVLFRLEDGSASHAVIFADVDPNAWYGEAVAWAAGEGIAAGNGNGFAPDASITREQLAVMLYRYANAVGCDKGSWGSLSTFRDRGEISDWAEEAMSWAVGSGLMEGRDGRYLAPQETASRAEVAAILMRMMPMLV